MGNEAFDREAAAVEALLPAGPRVAIIGSTAFWHPESLATCEAIGRRLAGFDHVVLLTGGVEGVGEAVGRSFFGARGSASGPRGVYHVLPCGYPGWDYGETVFAGRDMEERREILGRLATCYVVVEGGPGTAHEASVALGRSACILPVGRSGGHAQGLHSRLPRPSFAGESAWGELMNAATSPERVAEAVSEIVAGFGRSPREGA